MFEEYKVSNTGCVVVFATGKCLEEKHSVEMSASQSVHVVWDDPTGR